MFTDLTPALRYASVFAAISFSLAANLYAIAACRYMCSPARQTLSV